MISGMMYMILKNSQMIDRRQYFVVLVLISILTFSFFSCLIYVVYKQTTQSRHPDLNPISILESALDLLGSLSNNTFSFIFSLLMNFFLIMGIYSLNMCSLCLGELAKGIEQSRTGGRNQNEVELNSFSITMK
jgi:uncharacterized membrane protein SpoIIM required for sporulation